MRTSFLNTVSNIIHPSIEEILFGTESKSYEMNEKYRQKGTLKCHSYLSNNQMLETKLC